ncbi:hypothetical protein B0I35DRAFT_446736 [Stachybotrys elegans]|uniref:Peptidase A1 domain-containing protein n=1 Tax=Stachybotrys elegans TaxID=80388 RepID=A0A8K0WJX4_9HYPO|nr:hypothetical protein B0I35DRAFT_446736 [Stachybotrys elegans]
MSNRADACSILHYALLLTPFFSISTAASNCSPRPVLSEIRNVSLPNANGQQNRGIAFRVGTPGQELIFDPRWPTNNIHIYGSDYSGGCGIYSDTACPTMRGGLYVQRDSTSAGAALGSTAAEEDDRMVPQSHFISDVLSIDNQTSPPLPIGIQNTIAQNKIPHTPLHVLGLGDNSTVLQMLKDTEKIASRTWTKFNGWIGADKEHQRDGYMLFGGYDRAKVLGTGHKIPIGKYNSNCRSRLRVFISDLGLNFPNGTYVSLHKFSLSRNLQPFESCILPYYPLLLSMNNGNFFDRFMQAIDLNSTEWSEGLVPDGRVIPLEKSLPDVNLTISILSGPSITIPYHQLFLPQRDISETTGAVMITGPEKILPIKEFTDNEFPILGELFLSAAVVMANLDAGVFTIWEANQESNDQQLVAVDETGQEVTEFCEPASATTPTSSPTNSPLGSENESTEASEPDRGAVIGIIVGSVVAVAMVVTASSFSGVDIGGGKQRVQ